MMICPPLSAPWRLCSSRKRREVRMASATAPIARLFSRDEFQQMIDSGLFAGEKVELLDGAVITISPQNTPHAAAVNRLNYQLMKLCGPEVYIRVQSPIALDEHNPPE